ncbi:hypothetical protein Pdw03_2194 [Penicillium digitatum]|uniref:Uncharacterized protein n=1 Tax=Penicillium digitatum TaxID=36651 RepID=A0A7T7BPF9_PENDI|nr:hypothetical protein Pdw03_2194 [Penicillium digitatum]
MRSLIFHHVEIGKRSHPSVVVFWRLIRFATEPKRLQTVGDHLSANIQPESLESLARFNPDTESTLGVGHVKVNICDSRERCNAGVSLFTIGVEDVGSSNPAHRREFEERLHAACMYGVFRVKPFRESFSEAFQLRDEQSQTKHRCFRAAAVRLVAWTNRYQRQARQ